MILSTCPICVLFSPLGNRASDEFNAQLTMVDALLRQWHCECSAFLFQSKGRNGKTQKQNWWKITLSIWTERRQNRKTNNSSNAELSISIDFYQQPVCASGEFKLNRHPVATTNKQNAHFCWKCLLNATALATQFNTHQFLIDQAVQFMIRTHAVPRDVSLHGITINACVYALN